MIHKKMQRVLVTGGAGFIGSNFVRFLIKKGYCVTVLDNLSYAGRRENLGEVISDIDFIKGDITEARDVRKAIKGVRVIVNFAAHTHVDRSIDDAAPFFKTNFYGTYNLLNLALKSRVELFLQISTDEVYGSILRGSCGEDACLNPSSPYAVTKALADRAVEEFHGSHNFPVIIVRSCNNYGPYQYPEKFIPLAITSLLRGGEIPMYGEGFNVRDWIYVDDTCFAIELILRKGRAGSVYNISAGVRRRNIELAKIILKKMGKTSSSIKYVKDRADHDFRYAMDSSKLLSLGWKDSFSLSRGLDNTIDWYRKNEKWWQKIV